MNIVGKTYQLHNYIFHIIYEVIKNGVSLYGYGRNGKQFADFFNTLSVPIHHIYDRSSSVENIKSGGVLSPICIPSSDDHSAVCVITPAKGKEEILPLVKPYYNTIITAEDMCWLLYTLPKFYDKSTWDYRSSRPFDFYESPFSGPVETEYELAAAARRKKSSPVIDWNLSTQYDYCRYIVACIPEFQSDFVKCCRYQEPNFFFEGLDAITYYSILRRHHPQRIIEIGSGFSTRLAMDTSDERFDGKIQITCIEPYPARLLSGVANAPYEKLELKQEAVQTVNLDVFDVLKENDVLFIDSSHVVRAGGDVPFELSEILPHLASGVLIHFHDIFYPFTYPMKWLQMGLPYNETYVLQAFLSHNDAYEILFFTNMMTQDDAPEARRLCALAGTNGGSLWLRKK